MFNHTKNELILALIPKITKTPSANLLSIKELRVSSTGISNNLTIKPIAKKNMLTFEPSTCNDNEIYWRFFANMPKYAQKTNYGRLR